MKHQQKIQIQIMTHTSLGAVMGDHGLPRSPVQTGAQSGVPGEMAPREPLLPTPESRPIEFTRLGLIALLCRRGTLH